jgi:hypothetical protein
LAIVFPDLVDVPGFVKVAVICPASHGCGSVG